MKLFECEIDLNGTWRRVRVEAENDRAAWELLVAQYGEDSVKGYPHPVTRPFWA